MDTTEQDVIKPEGDGSSGSGNGATGTRRKPRSFFAAQLFSIAAASFLVIVVTWISFKWGYHTEKSTRIKEVHVEQSIPASVYGPLIGVIFVGTVASFWAEMKEKLAGTFGDEQEEEGPREFKPLPEWLLKYLVYILTGVVVFALIRLVSLTGGFSGSPFNPLMTAPAVVGAFMAFSKKTTIQLTVVGILSVWLSIEVVDFSSLHIVNPDLWIGIPPARTDKPIPLVAESWVFGLIATSMLIIAGGLSYYRHSRQPQGIDPDHSKLSVVIGRWLRSRGNDADDSVPSAESGS